MGYAGEKSLLPRSRPCLSGQRVPHYQKTGHRRPYCDPERDPKRAGKRGGIQHFGFRLVKPAKVATIVARVKRADGKVLSDGEFALGLPYVFSEDPDGYEVEVWFEAPTPVDPKPARSK